MIATPRYETVEGPIARILGSHQTTDVTIEKLTVANTPDGSTPTTIGVGLAVAATFLAIYTVRRASILAELHAKLDRQAA